MELREGGRAGAVGIDLGTTDSCIGVWRSGRVKIVPSFQGGRTTPSCVAFPGSEVHEMEGVVSPEEVFTRLLVGEPAEEQRSLNLAGTVSGVKRLIGRKFGEVSENEYNRYFPFNAIAADVDVAGAARIHTSPRIVIRHLGEEKRYSPEEISAFILTTMLRAAKSHLGTEVKRAVVAVPAYFDSTRRIATVTAATMAGLEKIKIVDEPFAAAVAYGFDRGSPRTKNVLVFDLGGATLDVSLLQIEGSRIEVMASISDINLGGEDFDYKMMLYFADQFKRLNGHRTSSDIFTNSRALSRLKSASERAKRSLSFASEAAVAIEYLHQGIDFQSSITRNKFEEINEKFFFRCVGVLDHFFAEATSIGRENVQEVVLVGGSTRIPRIQNLLRNYFAGEVNICMSINPDKVVAYGATVIAARLVERGGKNVGEVAVPEVVPLSLGVSGPGGIMVVVIPRNTPIPTKKSTEFYLPSDNQEWLLCGIYEGERSMADDNHYLAGIVVKGLPLQHGYLPKITMTFEVDAKGVLRVTAETKIRETYNDCLFTFAVGEWGTGRQSLSDIAGMVETAEAHKVDDERRMRKAKAQAKLKALLCNLRLLVTKQENESKLKAGGKELMEAKIAETTNWVRLNEGAEAADFKTKTKHLKDTWSNIFKNCPPFVSIQMLHPSYWHQ